MLTDVGDSAAIAARTLGYGTLKDLQRSVIVTFVNGNDVFAVLPTGYEKSLCFACLPLVFDILFHPQEASKYDSWAHEWLGYSHQCPFSLWELC